MRLVQVGTAGGDDIRVAVVDGDQLKLVAGEGDLRALALEAGRAGRSLEALIGARGTAESLSYDATMAEGRILPPLTHPDPAHMLVTGTGLTHLGSAATRSTMHEKIGGAEEELTDSMKMFKWGLEGGKPEAGEAGVSPEWFYKGDGSWIVAPGAPMELPDYAEDGGEEPEIVGLYVIAEDGTPLRVGFALANEYSDHVLERRNYLLLAHSKLRTASYGPEVLLGELPADIEGTSRILRNGEAVWSKAFSSGEANMSHTVANLEHHHFKYDRFRRPGDVHIHFFGTATLSFADDFRAEPGDVFEISAPPFGRPLTNGLARTAAPTGGVKTL